MLSPQFSCGTEAAACLSIILRDLKTDEELSSIMTFRKVSFDKNTLNLGAMK